MRKICFAASTGGHFEQLLMLKPLMKNHQSFIITEKSTYDVSVDDVKVYYVEQVNRKEKTFLFKILKTFIKVFRIFKSEKPTHIISTGALSTIPACVLGKIFGAKVIFIESFAKIKSPTLTGKLMYKLADEFIVQWEDMLKIYPKATYKGGIY